MAASRPLVEGLKAENTVDRALGEKFVYQGLPKTESVPSTPATAAAETEAGKGKADSSAGRIPLTIRFRPDYAAAIKRASLERQLQGIKANSVQGILEAAVEPWLRNNGYLR